MPALEMQIANPLASRKHPCAIVVHFQALHNGPVKTSRSMRRVRSQMNTGLTMLVVRAGKENRQWLARLSVG